MRISTRHRHQVRRSSIFPQPSLCGTIRILLPFIIITLIPIIVVLTTSTLVLVVDWVVMIVHEQPSPRLVRGGIARLHGVVQLRDRHPVRRILVPGHIQNQYGIRVGVVRGHG